MENVKILPKAIVCEDCIIKGDVTISSGCIIHPSSKIVAENGPIIFGENCIIEEYATIINSLKSSGDGAEPNKTLKIGANNIFEVGCFVEAQEIGDKNIFECKSYVSPDVQVTSGCIIGAGTQLYGKQILPENSVIYGKQCLQRNAMEKQLSHVLQIDSLRKILPNYHHLKKTLDAKGGSSKHK